MRSRRYSATRDSAERTGIMAAVREVYQLSARELRDRLDAGELTSTAVVAALQARADALDVRIGAFVQRFGEAALEAAAAADARREAGEALGPLDGLPITIKESMATVGTPSTLGLEGRLRQIEEADSVIVELLRGDGAVLLGKTNVPQLLMCHETDNAIWGPTRNPWNLERAPGGSSGGESAAIAAGLTPWGVGTDIGGSIRVPCAWTGIFGLKPTVDRWSNVRSYTALTGQEIVRGQCGPMARTAADVAWLFGALDARRQHRLDPTVPPLAPSDPSATDVRGLRVGFYVDDGFFPATAPIARGVSEAVAALEEAGAVVVPFEPPAGPEIVATYVGALSSDGGKAVANLLRGEALIPQLKALRRLATLPGPLRRLAANRVRGREPRVAGLLDGIGKRDVASYWDLAARRTTLRRQVLAAWDVAELDVVVCPAHATAAIGHGQFPNFGPAGSYAMRFNLVNFPAGVAPVGRVRPDETRLRVSADRRPDRLDRQAAEVVEGTEGLPTAVQVVARPYREDLVLAVMLALDAGLRSGSEFPATPVDPTRKHERP